MSSDVAYAFAAMVCYGVGDVIYKRISAGGAAPDAFIMAQGWVACPVALAFGWFTGNLHLSLYAALGGLAGVFMLVGFVNYVESLKRGQVSVVAPVYRLNFVVAAALAIVFLGEALTRAKLIGFALALSASWLLLGGAVDDHAADRPARRRALLQVVLATVATGLASFCHKVGLAGGATPETLLASQTIVLTTLLTGKTYARRGTIRLPLRLVADSAIAASAVLSAFLLLLHSMRHGDASVMVPISQLGFGIAAVLGVVVFRERLSLRKVAGLGAAGIALLALAAG